MWQEFSDRALPEPSHSREPRSYKRSIETKSGENSNTLFHQVLLIQVNRMNSMAASWKDVIANAPTLKSEEGT